MTPPGKAEQKGQGNEGKEFFELGCFRHMGRLQIKTPFLEMAEELLYTPSPPVEAECFFAGKAIANNVEVAVPPTFALDDLTGKENVHPPEFFSFRCCRFACDPILTGGFPSNRDVLFDSHDVANAFIIQPFEPFFTSEFTIHC